MTSSSKIKFFIFISAVVVGANFLSVNAAAVTDCYLINECSHFRRDPSASPSPGTQVKINPSAVPTDKGFGLEAIYHSVEPDLSLVRGNGRMGASLSPSNSEETFFGAPGFELSEDLLERKKEQKKYPNQKFTLATAFELAEKNGTGFRRYNLKLGAMAKYNKLTGTVNPGGGISGVLGPIAAGFSAYKDETQLTYTGDLKTITKYNVQTYNVGLYLTSLILNYSHLRLEDEDKTYLATVRLYTASLTMGKFILTAAKRTEQSPAPAYNYETETLEIQEIKEEYFGGVQYSLSKNFMMGALYNYYLLREASVTATLFF
ncbi:hypothetical protein [Bdellovibrio bacteriovorus]|uniref:hypothetical protein n=1 Tax=Bdellovibrio bacteriovorus TaxID=959 RepID=UPI0035A6D40E